MRTLTTDPSMKMPRFRMGVRQKVLLVLLSVLLTALTASAWLAFREEKASLLEEVNQRGSYISRFVAKSLSYSVASDDKHGIQLLLDELTSSVEVDYAKVSSTPKGITLGQSGNAVLSASENQLAGNDLMIFTRDITSNGDVIGALQLGLSTRYVTARLENQKFALLKREALLILLIALGEFFALSYIIVRPVDKLTNYLRNNVDEEGRLVGEIPMISNDEFGQLAQQFNTLGKQLNEANKKLHSKIESSDRRMLETNQQLKQLNDEFRLLSITDPLTGLFNRRHFDTLMKTELSMGSRHGDPNSILLIDIDYFKAINDTYGHYVGDTVLKALTRTLKKNLRHTDAVCRLGGEEFAVLCKRADPGGATELAEKLRKIVETTPMAPKTDNELMITISIGVASVAKKTENNTEITPEQLYKDVDAALYYSKNHGRNRVTHVDELYRENPERPLEPFTPEKT